jgi:hypothetical protein
MSFRYAQMFARIGILARWVDADNVAWQTDETLAYKAAAREWRFEGDQVTSGKKSVGEKSVSDHLFNDEFGGVT